MIEFEDSYLRNQNASLYQRLDAARSTITEPQKRIGELDDDLRQIGRAEACHLEEIAELRQALATERQRRESAEAVVELYLNDTVSGLDADNAAADHFTRYPSDAENESADGRRG